MDRKNRGDIMKLVYCLRNSFTHFVIPAKAGIQKNKDWIPHQVRNDSKTRDNTIDLLKDKGGFTLIELLIAMLILFIGLIAVAGLASTAILGNANAKWSTAATTLAEERMEELKSIGFLGLTNTSWTSPETITLTGAGRFERQWRITTPPPGMTDTDIGLIEVRVSWTDRGRTREVNLATYIAR
jgi:type II secretory pathway pseudopilin PulG